MIRYLSRNLTTLQQNRKVVGELENQILNKLKTKYQYNLFHAEIVNSSWKHDKPAGSESHLELILVTPEFEGIKKSQREETVKQFLNEEIKKTEAFTFKLLTPSKWYDSNLRGLKLDTNFADPPFGKS